MLEEFLKLETLGMVEKTWALGVIQASGTALHSCETMGKS